MGWWAYSFAGMYWLWWLFWIVLLAVIFGFAWPVPRGTLRGYRDQTPLGILRRRYAAGEITTQEYEERRAILERDREHADERALGEGRRPPTTTTTTTTPTTTAPPPPGATPEPH